MNEKTTFLEISLLAHRFRVSVPADTNFRFTKQILDCELDYVNHTIALSVRQPVEDNGFKELIQGLANTDIKIEYINGTGNVAATTTFSHCEMIDHKFKLDYANYRVATHHIVFKYHE